MKNGIFGKIVFAAMVTVSLNSCDVLLYGLAAGMAGYEDYMCTAPNPYSYMATAPSFTSMDYFAPTPVNLFDFSGGDLYPVLASTSSPSSSSSSSSSGYTPSITFHEETCSLCHGSGRIDSDDAPSFGLGNKWCDKCNASVPMSHVHGGRTCPGCSGTGKVTKRD